MCAWISVDERLPEADGLVLIHAPCAAVNKPLICNAWWCHANQRWELITECWAEAITHWMPLPAPPEKT